MSHSKVRGGGKKKTDWTNDRRKKEFRLPKKYMKVQKNHQNYAILYFFFPSKPK